jgi:hypothetical protein
MKGFVKEERIVKVERMTESKNGLCEGRKDYVKEERIV